MVAHRRGLGHGRDRLGTQVLRVWAGEPDPADALHRADRPEQVGEERASPGQVPPVGVDVLTQQGDLGHAPVGQDLDLGDELGEGSRRLAATDRGHDAKGARVVAADLDGDPGRIGKVPDGGQRGGTRPGRGRIGLGQRLVEDLHQRARLGRSAQQGGGPPQIVGAEHDVHVSGPLLDVLPVHLGQAPTHGNLHVRPALAQGLQVAQMAVELVVRVLTDATGVEDDHVGRLEVVGGHQAVGGEQPGQALGVVVVHLAAVGADMEGAGGHTGRSPVRVAG